MTDSQDWTQPQQPCEGTPSTPVRQPNDETPLWEEETPWQQRGPQPNEAAPRHRPEPPAVRTPDPPSGYHGRDPRKLYRRGNVALSVIMGMLVAGGIANALLAHKTPSKPAASVNPKTPAAHLAAPGANTTLSATQQKFVSDVQSSRKWNSGSRTSASRIAAFGKQVCTERRDGQSQLKVISGAQGAWKNSSSMWADSTVRLAEQELCASYLTPETVTFIVRGTPGAAEVTYGTAGLDFSGEVPMRVIRPLGNPRHYEIRAQLEGDGTVTCVIKVDGIWVSAATASGDGNIASCKIGQDPGVHLWANENEAGRGAGHAEGVPAASALRTHLRARTAHTDGERQLLDEWLARIAGRQRG
jgi:hypothetical protein